MKAIMFAALALVGLSLFPEKSEAHGFGFGRSFVNVRVGGFGGGFNRFNYGFNRFNYGFGRSFYGGYGFSYPFNSYYYPPPAAAYYYPPPAAVYQAPTYQAPAPQPVLVEETTTVRKYLVNP